MANIEESVGENGSVVTDYQYEPNNYSDSQFMKERLEQLNRQDDTVTLVTDRAYGGVENIVLAKDKNIDLITTDMTGRPPEDIIADFEFSEDGKKVLRCPAGYEPKSCSYSPSNNTVAVSFLHEQCAFCTPPGSV